MTTSVSAFEKSKNFLFKTYKDDISKMLLWTGSIAWILSAVGQIFGIASNKKIDKKEKRFLIPQEMADAAINITSFILITSSVQNLAKKMVAKGRIITPEIKKFCNNKSLFVKGKDGEAPNIGKAIQDKIKEYQAVLDVNANNDKIKLGVSPSNIKNIEGEIRALREFDDKTYAPFEGGVGVVGSLLGAVVSSNIITPLLRNPMAAYKQKTSMEQEQLENDAKLYNDNRVILAQNDVDRRSTIKRPAVNPYPTSGSMKI